MRCTLYCATIESSVWVGIGAIIIRATLSALSYVEAGRVIRSRDDSRDLRFVSTKEKMYMKEVLEAANNLREEYRKMRGMAMPA